MSGTWLSRGSCGVFVVVTVSTSRSLCVKITLGGSYGTDLREGVTVALHVYPQSVFVMLF